jgi:hypothetical protein
MMRARLAPLALQTWVPWFFMLSGFVLTQARLKSDRAETIVSFLRKRTAVIYPLYAVGLASALTVRWSQGVRFPASYELMAQGILAQSLVPWLPEWLGVATTGLLKLAVTQLRCILRGQLPSNGRLHRAACLPNVPQPRTLLAAIDITVVGLAAHESDDASLASAAASATSAASSCSCSAATAATYVAVTPRFTSAAITSAAQSDPINN